MVDGGGGAVVSGGVVVGGAAVGGTVVGGAVVGGGVVVGGAPVVVPPGYATCESLVVAYGHSSIHMNQCRPDTDVACADALLSAGHPTTSLLFCSSVEPNCARQWLLSGGAPVGLNRCRY